MKRFTLRDFPTEKHTHALPDCFSMLSAAAAVSSSSLPVEILFHQKKRSFVLRIFARSYDVHSRSHREQREQHIHMQDKKSVEIIPRIETEDMKYRSIHDIVT
jgi:hypothetical protein